MGMLTPTSYSILGLLAVRTWSSYELTKQLQRSLGRFWPRAESKLYEEPKKLVERGLAESSVEMIGRRRRTVYAITSAGRAELAAWLQRPADPPQVESEHLLKVFLADAGTTADLRQRLAELRTWATARMQQDADIASEYLGGAGEFADRLAVISLIGRYSQDFARMTRDWADWALSVTAAWPERPVDAVADQAVLRGIADG